MNTISIVIPTHNEEENLPSLIDSLLTLIKQQQWNNAEIVLVDDHSTDSTPQICDSYAQKHAETITVIHRRNGNKGMGNTLKEGTARARGNIIIWTMGDKSDNIETYPKLVQKINEGYDMVFGSRYMKGGSRGDLDRTKALMSSGYTVITRILFGTPVHDITNAFRAFKKTVFNSITLENNDFAISPEFSIKAQLKGFKLGEVPTTYNNRKAGTTKFKFIKMGIKYTKLLIKYRFKV